MLGGPSTLKIVTSGIVRLAVGLSGFSDHWLSVISKCSWMNQPHNCLWLKILTHDKGRASSHTHTNQPGCEIYHLEQISWQLVLLDSLTVDILLYLNAVGCSCQHYLFMEVEYYLRLSGPFIALQDALSYLTVLLSVRITRYVVGWNLCLILHWVNSVISKCNVCRFLNLN